MPTCTLEAFHVDLHVGTVTPDQQVADVMSGDIRVVPPTESRTKDYISGHIEAQSDPDIDWPEDIDQSDIDDLLLDGHLEQVASRSDYFPSRLARNPWDGSATSYHHEHLDSSLSAIENNQNDTIVDEVLPTVLAGVGRAILADQHIQYSSHFRHLSDLAPAVFCSAYRPFVASRAVFTPTIGHALSRVNSRMLKDDCVAPASSDTHNESQAEQRLWLQLQKRARIEAKKDQAKGPASGKVASRLASVANTDLVTASQESWNTATETLDVDLDEDEEGEEDLLGTLGDYAVQGDMQCVSEATMNDAVSYNPSSFLADGSYQGRQYVEVLADSAAPVWGIGEFEDDQIMLDI
ncbi:hypothetical protein LTR78_006356 [Recurvomyces mirabilis]|uniref:Uncharacterized protein n=1 Tax=Recurvomyces mirabilis TaxID=574656 RepID=A0AAE0WL94_9PEZI|nr:hypothetical protein LTR78_006356 [Recurvomyces mirabilis]KAK5152244.1 hypothetical protein LTS14_008620 [Recurvomyces mirabilis]